MLLLFCFIFLFDFSVLCCIYNREIFMRKIIVCIIVILIFFPNSVRASIELEDGLNILAFDFGG